MTDLADILNAAADLLEPEGAWIQGAFGRDEDGRAVGSATPTPVAGVSQGPSTRSLASMT
jgi:hypothetical protein